MILSRLPVFIFGSIEDSTVTCLLRIGFQFRATSTFSLTCVSVFFVLTDRASTILVLSNIRGCQSGTWSARQEQTRERTPTKLQREHKKQKQSKNDENIKDTDNINIITRKITCRDAQGTHKIKRLHDAWPCLKIAYSSTVQYTHERNTNTKRKRKIKTTGRQEGQGHYRYNS